jgi:hypothetical protein
MDLPNKIIEIKTLGPQGPVGPAGPPGPGFSPGDNITTTGYVSASEFYGDGSNLTGVTTNTGSFIVTASSNQFVFNTIYFTKGDGSTFSVDIPTPSPSPPPIPPTVNTSSFFTNATLIGGTLTFTRGDGNFLRLTLPSAFPYTGSAGINGDLNVTGFVSASTYYGDGSNLEGVEGFPYTGSAEITGSLGVTGSLSVTSNVQFGTPTQESSLTIYTDDFSGGRYLQIRGAGTEPEITSNTVFRIYGGPGYALQLGNHAYNWGNSAVNIYGKGLDSIFTTRAAGGGEWRLYQKENGQFHINPRGTGFNLIQTIPDSVMFQVDSTDMGVRFPRHSTTTRDAISSPVEGLLLYNTSSQTFNYYNSSSWVEVGKDPFPYTGSATITGSLRVSGSLGINRTSLSYPLDVVGSARFTLTSASNQGFIFDISDAARPKIEFWESIERLYIQRDTDDSLRIGGFSGNIASFKNTGVVGIGTTTPTERLDVNGNIIVDNNGTGRYYFRNQYDATITALSLPNYNTIRIGGGNNSSVQIARHSDNIIATFGTTGVGIGITTPSTELHVSGNISASFYYGDGSNLTGINTGSWNGIFTGSAVISGSLGVSGSSTFGVGQLGWVTLAGDGGGGVITGQKRLYLNSTLGYDIDAKSTGNFNFQNNLSNTYVHFDGTNKRVGIGTITPSSSLHVSGNLKIDGVVTGSLSIEGSGSTIFEVNGSEGQLFSITDSLSGSLFAVSDVSGLPILEVFSDDRIIAGAFNNKALVISGSHTTLKNTVISGSLNVSSSVTASTYYGDGSNLTGINTGSWNGIFTGSASITGSLRVIGNITGSGILNLNDGKSNIIVSNQTLPLSSTSDNNIIIGLGAALNMSGSNADRNIIIGTDAAKELSNTNSRYNVIIGYNAFSNHSGSDSSNHVIIGYNAGLGMDNSGYPSSATIIGAGASSDNSFRTLAIGAGAVGGYNGHAIGFQAIAPGDGALAIGAQASAGISATAIGQQSSAIASSIAIGRSVASTSGAAVNIGSGGSTYQGVLIGYSARGNGSQGAAVGFEVGNGNYGATLGYQAAKWNVGNSNVSIGRYAMLGVSGSTNVANTVAIGEGALQNITTGTGNTAIGYQAGDGITTSGFNTLVGFGTEAGSSNSSTVMGYQASGVGSRVVAIGYQAQGGGVTNGWQNVGIGYQANFQGASENAISLGYQAGYNGTVQSVSIGGNAGFNGSDYSVMVGHDAGKTATANNTVAIGYQALTALTTGTGNTAIGYQAGLAVTTGINNIHIGYATGDNNNSYTTLIGYTAKSAGDNAVSIGWLTRAGTRSTSIGTLAGANGGGGQNNVYIGDSSGRFNTGANNVIIGRYAGYNSSTSSNSIFIGYQAGENETGSNKLYIENSNSSSPLIYGEFDNNLVRINGKLLVSNSLDVTGSVSASTYYGDGSNLTGINTGSWNGIFTGSAVITGSTTISGSLKGSVIDITPTNQTASLNCSLSNFFTLTLSSSANTFLTASNIQPGQTINLRITQPATSGSLSYGSEFKFPNGLPYSVSATGSVVDILSFIAFDSNTLYGSSLKNFV